MDKYSVETINQMMENKWNTWKNSKTYFDKLTNVKISRVMYIYILLGKILMNFLSSTSEIMIDVWVDSAIIALRHGAIFVLQINCW